MKTVATLFHFIVLLGLARVSFSFASTLSFGNNHHKRLSSRLLPKVDEKNHESTLATATDSSLSPGRRNPSFLRDTIALTRVMGLIVGKSLKPSLWIKHHWKHGKSMVLLAATAASLCRLLSTRAAPVQLLRATAQTALSAASGAIFIRSFVLPAVYGAFMVYSWSALCHRRSWERRLREMYILFPWWLSNKLLPDNVGEVLLPHFLTELRAEPETVQLANSFVQSREQRLDIQDPLALAQSSGTLVLYHHAFGSTLSEADWNHVIMHCCYGRILDDFQDMEEDRRDGNCHRNFFLLQGTLSDWQVHAIVVQAMQSMQNHERKIENPSVRQYAEGATLALDSCIKFKSSGIKSAWRRAQFVARGKASQSF